MTTAAGNGPTDLKTITVGDVRIAYVDTGGSGPPLVLVHGSWGSHHNWDAVVPGLARHLRVVALDRRGHGGSEQPPGQGHSSEDVEDLAGLIQRLGVTPAWVAGGSFGAVVTVQLAAAHPELVRGFVAHEPPFLGLLEPGTPEARAVEEIEAGPIAEVARRIAAGDHGGAAELFADGVAMGPGSWERMPEAMRASMIAHAPTYLDELHDREWRVVDEERLRRFDGPVLLTRGDRSPPMFAPIVRRLGRLLPQAEHTTYAGAGHIPHATHPDLYVDRLVRFVRSPRND